MPPQTTSQNTDTERGEDMRMWKIILRVRQKEWMSERKRKEKRNNKNATEIYVCK